MKVRTGFFIAFLFLANIAFGATIDKAFEALKKYDYFEAKQLFEKSLKKYPSAASYGLATIYYRNDNPFHQLDSAYSRIVRAESTYSPMKEKDKEKFKKYGFDYPAIEQLRKNISTTFFSNAKKQLSEQSMDEFQKKHPWAVERNRAIELRDSLGFESATKQNNSAAFNGFLVKYPESKLFATAQIEFYRLQYRENTKEDNLTSYINFERKFPENPYVADAQDQIYRISTKQNRVQDYDAFIKKFPKNRNVDPAWRKLYQLYMSEYSSARLKQFQEEYPQYPFADELARDQQLAGSVLIPCKKEGLFGWMDLNGKVIIPCEYSSVGFFKEGLAWVEKNSKFGYVNKANEVKIPLSFESAHDFENGRAIVQSKGLYGMIDRSGTYLIKPEFKDLGTFTEGLIYAQKDSLYGYYDGFGFQRISPVYDEAFSFANGMAKIIYKGMEGYIDQYGAFIVKPQFQEVNFFSDTILTFEDEDLIRFCNLKGEQLPNLGADEVGKLNNDRAVYIYDGKLGYLDKKGKLVIGMTFEEYTGAESEASFIGNYAKVKKAGKFGIIDKSGKTVIPFKYSQLGLPGSMIAFEKAGKWGFIDLSNKVSISPSYEYAESFSDGLAIVQMLTLRGAINSKNQIIIPLEHTTIKKLDKEHYLVSRGAKYGIYSDKGKLLVPLEYGQIRKVQDDFLLLHKGTEIHFLQLSTDSLIQPVFE